MVARGYKMAKGYVARDIWVGGDSERVTVDASSRSNSNF
jgi:hypothetical protein